MKFPEDAPIRKVVKTFERLGFELVREGIRREEFLEAYRNV
jgi:hypothetical protein